MGAYVPYIVCLLIVAVGYLAYERMVVIPKKTRELADLQPHDGPTKLDAQRSDYDPVEELKQQATHQRDGIAGSIQKYR